MWKSPKDKEACTNFESQIRKTFFDKNEPESTAVANYVLVINILTLNYNHKTKNAHMFVHCIFDIIQPTANIGANPKFF